MEIHGYKNVNIVNTYRLNKQTKKLEYPSRLSLAPKNHKAGRCLILVDEAARNGGVSVLVRSTAHARM
jgi:hypothetical protein